MCGKESRNRICGKELKGKLKETKGNDTFSVKNGREGFSEDVRRV